MTVHFSTRSNTIGHLPSRTVGLQIRMNAELLIDFNEFWSRLSEDIQSARESVFIQTFALEGDAIGQQLAEALLRSPARDKRILADSFTRMVLSDRFRYSPSNLFDPELRREARATTAMMRRLADAAVGIKFTNPYGFSPRRILSRNHKKLIIVDNGVAYVGGINFSEHNAAWHDMMIRIEGEAAVEFLRLDFLSTWHGRDRVAEAKFEGMALYTLDGHDNRRAFQRVIELIDAARESIFVQSPYITFPFYERLREATHRGVAVKVLTPAENNWSFFSNYARLESAWSQIDLRLFKGGMSHLKAMLIDDQHLIAGSSNFDYFSYRIHQEILAVITLPDIISEFRQRVMVPDFANAESVKCHASSVSKQWLSWKVKLLDAAMTVLT